MDARRSDDTPTVRLWPWPPTAGLALVGASVWVSGFFLLAAAGRDYGLAVYALILGGAVAVSVPVLALAAVITASEAVVGRAWASGFALLPASERGARGIASRALRYAGFLWLANGSALWFATLVAQI